MTATTKKFIGGAVLVILVYYVVTSPDTAATGAYQLVHWVGSTLASLATGIKDFINSLVK